MDWKAFVGNGLSSGVDAYQAQTKIKELKKAAKLEEEEKQYQRELEQARLDLDRRQVDLQEQKYADEIKSKGQKQILALHDQLYGKDEEKSSTPLMDKEFKDKDLPTGTEVSKDTIRAIVQNEVLVFEKANGRTSTKKERREIGSAIAAKYGISLNDIMKD